MVTKYQVLKSICKYAGEKHGLKIALNLSTDVLEQKIVDTNNPDILDFYIVEMYQSVHFTKNECLVFWEHPTIKPNRDKFPRLSALIAELFPPKADKVTVKTEKTKPVFYLGLSESLQQQFGSQGFIVASTGDCVTGEYAVKVLSLLWSDDSYSWPVHYKQHGYLLPITIDIRPDINRIYTTQKLAQDAYQDLNPRIKAELKKIDAIRNNGSEIIIPKLRSEIELEKQDKDFSSETPLFSIDGVSYYQSFIDKPIFSTNPLTLLTKNKGALISNGFKSSIKSKLLKPLVGNDGLIIENILEITYPDFTVSKPLTDASKFASRRKNPRKTTVKSKISWSTKFIPTVEKLEIALQGIVRLPGRSDNPMEKPKDKLLVNPDGSINLVSDGKIVGKIGHLNLKTREGYWLPGIPVNWVEATIENASPLDRALSEILEGVSKRASKNLDRLTVDYALENEHKSYINGLSKRELQRLKQSSRKYFLNHDNLDVMPINVRRSVDKLNDPTSTKLQREIANRNLMSYYLQIKK
jgi:hypothetical protein